MSDPKSNPMLIEPSLNISLEEISLIKDGIAALPVDRKKTIVFDRLIMKLGKVDDYWKKIEKVRKLNKNKLAEKLMEKPDA